MINHQDIYIAGFAGRRTLAVMIKQGAVQFAGNRKLTIYGTLSCASGKRMKINNRLFFATRQEALEKSYRPCGALHAQPIYFVAQKLNNNKIGFV